MNTAIKVPDIGSDEVEVIEILVKIGDKVYTEQPIITVEGNKTSMDIPSPQTGMVKEIAISIGDKIKTGELIMIIEIEDIISSTSMINKPEQILDTQNLTTQYKTQFIKSIEKITSDNEHSNNETYVHASPLIRRLAHDLNIDLSNITGTGRRGRIIREDIYDYIKKLNQYQTTVSSINITSDLSPLFLSPWPKVDFKKFGATENIEISRIQKISSMNLSRNYAMIPHVTHFDKTDITELEAFRKQQNSEAEKHKLNIKITPVIFIIKAVACALKQMPRFNSSLSEDNKYLILKKYINIGVAVDTPNGLVVPVLKNVNEKGIIELSRELTSISKKARDGNLKLDEVQGGCFTISSIGNLGTTYFTPIINAPEVAILGISKATIEPVWNGKDFMPRLILPISLSFDHRVIDGADGARFITIINNILRDIRHLIM